LHWIVHVHVRASTSIAAMQQARRYEAARSRSSQRQRSSREAEQPATPPPVHIPPPPPDQQINSCPKMDSSAAGTLVRTMTGHGTEYDALLSKGIPQHMLRHAWIACGGDPVAAERYVHDNHDQPDAFWHGIMAQPAQPEPEAAPEPEPAAEDELTPLAHARALVSALPPERLHMCGISPEDLEVALLTLVSRQGGDVPDPGLPVSRAVSAPTRIKPTEWTCPRTIVSPSPATAEAPSAASKSYEAVWGSQLRSEVEAARIPVTAGHRFLCDLQRGDWVDVNISSLRRQYTRAAQACVEQLPSTPNSGGGDASPRRGRGRGRDETKGPRSASTPEPELERESEPVEAEHWVAARVVSVTVDRGHHMREIQRGMRGAAGSWQCHGCGMYGPSHETGGAACVHCDLCAVCCSR
jgi:hypothetical protein